MSASDQPPLLRVVKGSPSAEELAALVVAFASVGSAPAPQPPTASGWSAYWRGIRAPLTPGPDAWRASGRI